MPTCHASSIVFDGHVLLWFGPDNATWSVPAGRLRAIRERVAESGDVRWLVEFEIDGQDFGLQSPANANGMDRVLTAQFGPDQKLSFKYTTVNGVNAF